MPTATPFTTALGLEGGFSLCLDKLDVSTFPSNWKWTTLSGVNADNYTAFSDSALKEKVNSSMAMAMNVYYNSYKVSGLSASTSGYVSFFNSRFQPSEGIKYTWSTSVSGMTNDDAASVKEPIERSCSYYRDLEKTEANVATYVHDNDTFQLGKVSILDTASRMQALYNGNKLLGYAAHPSGSDNPFESLVRLNNNLGNDNSCYIKISSIVNAEPDISEDFEKRTTDYGTVDGMDFVIIKYGNIRDEGTPTRDGYSGIVNTPSIVLNENSVQLSYVYKWDYDPDDDPNCGPYSRFCFSKFEDRNWSCSVSGPESLTYYNYN